MKPPRYAVLLLVATLTSLGGATHAEVIPNEPFIRAIDDAGLTFRETILKHYDTTRITDNEHMNYELAVRLEKPRLEIRYAIRAFDPSPREPSVRPETMAEPMFQMVALNIARRESDVLNSTIFPSAAVKDEFNADWGASAIVIPKKEFAGTFDRCLIVYIYKKRAGAFVFYLFNRQRQEAALIKVNDVFYALRFR
jgi:hypothetical protein